MAYNPYSIFESVYEQYSEGIHYARCSDDLPSDCRSAYLSFTFKEHSFAHCPELRYLSFSHAEPKWDDLRALSKLEGFSCEHASTRPPLPFAELLARNTNLRSLQLGHLTQVNPDALKGLERLSTLRSLKLERIDGRAAILNELPQLPALQGLHIEGVDLSELSLDLSGMPDLRVLILNDCGLTRLPQGLPRLERLEYASLSDNPLQPLPDGFVPPESLIEFELSRCALTTLPASLGAWKGRGKLRAQGNPFTVLPPQLSALKSRLQIPLRYRALYDQKARERLQSLGDSPADFTDFGFKLMVIEHLMYREQVLLPKFDVYEFVDRYTARRIDLEGEEAYAMIPEVRAWFEALPIPKSMLEELTELEADGGDEVYSQISPRWGGGDGFYMVQSAADAKLLPNLARVSSPFLSPRAVQQLERRGVSVDE